MVKKIKTKFLRIFKQYREMEMSVLQARACESVALNRLINSNQKIEKLINEINDLKSKLSAMNLQ